MERIFLALFAVLIYSVNMHAEEIGTVDTVFKLLGSNHKVIIEAFDDPKVDGVTCHLSRAKTGGISGSLGIAEDKAEASIACRQIGPIKLTPNLQNGEQVFSKKTSFIYKTLQVVRFYDKKRNVLIYLAYSDKLIEGSPKNSISTVPILNWK
jgi:CreA protein